MDKVDALKHHLRHLQYTRTSIQHLENVQEILVTFQLDNALALFRALPSKYLTETVRLRTNVRKRLVKEQRCALLLLEFSDRKNPLDAFNEMAAYVRTEGFDGFCVVRADAKGYVVTDTAIPKGYLREVLGALSMEMLERFVDHISSALIAHQRAS